jgi:hypothetical protein
MIFEIAVAGYPEFEAPRVHEDDDPRPANFAANLVVVAEAQRSSKRSAAGGSKPGPSPKRGAFQTSGGTWGHTGNRPCDDTPNLWANYTGSTARESSTARAPRHGSITRHSAEHAQASGSGSFNPPVPGSQSTRRPRRDADSAAPPWSPKVFSGSAPKHRRSSSLLGTCVRSFSSPSKNSTSTM